MTHKRTPTAAASATPEASSTTQTPQQKAAQTRRIRKAAREAEARQRAADEAREAEDAKLPASPPEPPAIDAHGFDPSEYKWLPVKRKPRKDGWTPQRQREFIGELAATGSVERAAMAVYMSPSSAHRLRRSPGAEQFSAAWDIALQHAAQVLLDVAFERAFDGSTEPVFDKEGRRCGTRHRQNDRLMMFLLRAYMPERFRHAHRDWRSPDEALPPAPAPMEEVLRRIEPVPPAEPHKLLPPDELEDELLIADMMDGELQLHHRGTGDTVNPWMPSAEWEARMDALKHPKRGGG